MASATVAAAQVARSPQPPESCRSRTRLHRGER
jgi:hypothetical protein